MATGGSEQTLCPLCLDHFTLPKFLPCFHTFCQHCIEDLVRGKPDTIIPCPACRKPTTLPPGGAADLQTNFYIMNPSAISPGTTEQEMCDTHPKKELEFYCTECEEAICFNCKLTRHESHKTDDINSAVNLRKQRLQSDQRRLQNAFDTIETQLKALDEDKHSLNNHKATVERSIRERHAAAVKRMTQLMAEQLCLLQSSYTDLNTEIAENIEKCEINAAILSSLLQQVVDAMNSGAVKHVLSVVEVMKGGCGSQSAVESLTSREQRPTLRPNLHSTVSDDDMMKTTRDYLGTVCMLEMKVTHKFQCSKDPDTEVFSLCHVDTDPPILYVSYDRLGKNENAPVQLFRESGESVFTFNDSMVGRISNKRHTKGLSMHPIPTSGVLATFNKSPASLHFKLVNNMSGQPDINRITVTSTDPFKTKDKTEFTIIIGPHRAFDVDGSENYFAAVEEGKTDSSTRQVHLYEKPKKDAVSTYQPPMENFQPADVLFHTLGGQPVLLVADQHNSTLHMLSFQGGQLKFNRFLCQGCPLLKEPTALTLDVEGRVWLACKGGRIVTVEEFM